MVVSLKVKDIKYPKYAIPGENIEDLKIPFACLATDIQAHQPCLY